MIKIRTVIGIAAAAIFANIITAPPSFCEPKKKSPAEAIHVLKISSEDGNAVVRTPDGKMQIVHAGDVLLIDDQTVQNLGKKADDQQETAAEKGSQVKINEIADGRIVLEEKTDKGTETVIVTLQNGKQKIRRISKVSGEERVLKAPKTEVVKDVNN